jgi:hypothetical protein
LGTCVEQAGVVAQEFVAPADECAEPGAAGIKVDRGVARLVSDGAGGGERRGLGQDAAHPLVRFEGLALDDADRCALPGSFGVEGFGGFFLDEGVDLRGDLGREGGAVTAAARQFQARAHQPGLGVSRVPGTQDGMPGLDSVRDQDLHRLPGQFLTRVPEQPLRLGIHQHDQAIGVHADRRVRRRLQQPGKSEISQLSHNHHSPHLVNYLKP